MEVKNIPRYFARLFLYACLIALPCCSLLCPFESGPIISASYRCKVPVVKYARVYPKPIVKITNHGSGKANIIQFYNSDSKVPPPTFYIDEQFKPASDLPIPAELNGTWLVQLSWRDKTYAGLRFLDFDRCY